MPEVVIDGVTYRPATTTAAPRLGVAITTRDRPKQLEQALTAHLKHSADAYIVVVDDGSATPVTVPPGVHLVRHETSVGIVAAKNASLTALMDAGCELLALWDDDAWPIVDGWWEPYAASPEAHLAYQFLDLAGPRKLHDIAIIHQDAQHVAYTGQRGVMLWYRREAIETVGGFDPVYGRGMYEHSDLANRIHHAGLTTWRYADVIGSSKLIYSLDEHEAVEHSVPLKDRQELTRRNAEIHNTRRDTDGHPTYVEYRPQRDVVLTCLYGMIRDPQRRGQQMTLDMVQPLATSVAGAEVIIASDLTGTVNGATVIPADIAGENVFFKRWLDAYQYLRTYPDVRFALICDGTDVTMQHEPWADLEPGRLYVGYEPKILADEWLRKNHPDPAVQQLITEHPDKQMLNAGVVLGDRTILLEFTHAMIAHYYDRKMRRFHKRDTAGDDLGDMGAFNLICWTRFADRLVWGSRVTTVFRQQETNGYSWLRHK